MRQAFYYALSQYNIFCHKTVAFSNNMTLLYVLQNEAIMA